MTVNSFLQNTLTFLYCILLVPIIVVVIQVNYIIWCRFIDPRRDDKRMLKLKAMANYARRIRHSIQELYTELGRVLDEQEKRTARYITGIKNAEEVSGRVRQDVEILRGYIEQVFVDHGTLLEGHGEVWEEKEKTF
jgi:hypothetical protein